MTRRRRTVLRAATWLLLLALLVAAGGCGGGDTTSDDSSAALEQEETTAHRSPPEQRTEDVRDEVCTITVRPGESIQQAIAAAPSGAVICLEQGEWEENVTIRKDLVLRGKGAELSVIRGSITDRPVMTVSALAAGRPITVRVERIMVTGGRVALSNGHGVLIEGPADAVVEHCIVSANQGAGILITGEAEARVEHCVISGNERLAGVVVADHAHALINQTTVTGTRGTGFSPGHGIWADDESNAVIAHSVIERNDGSGVSVGRNATALLVGNRIQLNGRYGVSQSLAPGMYPTLEGVSNIVPGRADPLGNKSGAFNPNELDTLTFRSPIAEMPPSEGAPHSIRVEPGQSIQDAIGLIADGGVILIGEGVWHEEDIVIYKSLTLQGAGVERSLIHGVIHLVSRPWVLEATEVVVEELSVVGGGGSLDVGVAVGDPFLECSWSNVALTLRNCHITGSSVGISVEGLARAAITRCRFSESGIGIYVGGQAYASINNSVICDNDEDGIVISDSARVALESNEILRNGRYGVVVYDWPYFSWAVFTGHVSGQYNTISGPFDPDGNQTDAVCPHALIFLTTREGGELDRREATAREGTPSQHGVRLMIKVLDTEDMEPAQRRDTVDRLVQIFGQRVDQFGLANVELRPVGEDHVEMRFPAAEVPQEARSLIVQTAILEFRKVLEVAARHDDLLRTDPTQDILRTHSSAEYYLVPREPLLTGEMLDSTEARVSTDPRSQGAYVALRLNKAAGERFVQILRELRVGDRVAIIIDGVVYSITTIEESVKQAAETGGWQAIRDSITISEGLTYDQAHLIAVILRTGALPTEVVVAEETGS